MKNWKNRLVAVVAAAMLLLGTLGVAVAEEESTVIFVVEAATISYGYVVAPVEVAVTEGEPLSSVVDRALTELGFSYEAYGTVEEGFYLTSIGKGGVLSKGAAVSSAEADAFCPPERLGEEFSEVIFAGLKPALESNLGVVVESVSDLDPGCSFGAQTLSAYDYCQMSGWMCSVDNVFPSVGMSDEAVKAGSVIRLQYTMAWGMDLGAGWGDFYPTADKTALLTKLATASEEQLANADVLAAYEQLKTTGLTPDATQEAVDAAVSAFDAAVLAASQQPTATPTPTPEVTETPSGDTDDVVETGDAGVTGWIFAAAAALAFVAALAGMKGKSFNE